MSQRVQTTKQKQKSGGRRCSEAVQTSWKGCGLEDDGEASSSKVAKSTQRRRRGVVMKGDEEHRKQHDGVNEQHAQIATKGSDICLCTEDRIEPKES